MIARASSATSTGWIARATFSTLAASTAPECEFAPRSELLGGAVDRSGAWPSESPLVLDAPVDPFAAETRLCADAQTFAARAAAISFRLGTPLPTTTIVTRRTSLPDRVRAEIR
jgi:hypothetical protein